MASTRVFPVEAFFIPRSPGLDCRYELAGSLAGALILHVRDGVNGRVAAGSLLWLRAVERKSLRLPLLAREDRGLECRRRVEVERHLTFSSGRGRKD